MVLLLGPTAALVWLVRGEGRRRDCSSAWTCMPALWHQDPRHRSKQPWEKRTAAFWDPLRCMVIGSFMVSSQKHWLNGSCTRTSSSPRTSVQTWQAGAVLVAHSTVPLLSGGRALLPYILHCLTPSGFPRAERVIKDRSPPTPGPSHVR